MSGGRADASTSTEDVQSRPLCLFYFTHPFGVLSPEPPTVTGARAFLDMQPLASFRSPVSPSDGYVTTASSRCAAAPWEPVLPVRDYTLGRGGDSGSSSLFSGDGRFVPYRRVLPPLRLPTSRDLAWDSSDDAWPARCSIREKFSLPPIELPCSASGMCAVSAVSAVSEVGVDRAVFACGGEAHGRCRRAQPARSRRARLSGVQRMVTCLMKRTVKAYYLVDESDTMGYIFDNCPTMNTCCFSVPLRPAVFALAAAGLVWGCLYIFLFSAAGARAAQELGVPERVGRGVRYVHGALGVLLLALNALLLAAAAYESDSLCEVYLWFMVLLWAAMLACALTIAICAAVEGQLVFAAVYFNSMFFALVLTAYFTAVVGNYRMTLP